MKIFTYGGLMSQTFMKSLGIDPSSRTPAFLYGYKLSFEKKAKANPKQGWANIRPAAQADKVYGILYELPEEILPVLDKNEDYPHGYIRKNVQVTLQTGKQTDAIVYIATPGMVADNLLPSKKYIDAIVESTDLLPVEYLETIRKTKTLEEVSQTKPN